MGNSKSASFDVDHLPEEVTPTSQSAAQGSFNGENDDHLKPYTATRPHSMYAGSYPESLVSENSSKGSEIHSTRSSTSITEAIPSLADRYKTAPSRLSISIDRENGFGIETRKSKSMHGHENSESFFDAIFATIEQEAGKASPNPPRRRTQTMANKKRWSSMFS